MPLSKILRNYADIIFACEVFTHLLIDRCTALKYDLRAGRDLYRAIPAVTQYLGFCGLVQRTDSV